MEYADFLTIIITSYCCSK